MKNFRILSVLMFALIVLFSNCRTSRQLTYFNDLSDTASLQTISTAKAPALQLQADDQVQISISSPSAEAANFFNLMAANPSASVTVPNPNNQLFINLYTVSNEGRITLPVIGDISAAGLTLEQLRQQIATALKPYLTNAIVSTRLTNFKVTVIGEVSKPFTVPVNGEKINVLEAIGAAGDLTIYGSRKKIKVIRKLADGNTEIGKIDLNSSQTFQSRFFNLHQNDIVYIQPNKNKAFSANNTTFWASMALSVASIVAIILTRN